MEGITKGWVFKQSKFLRRWQKEWMILFAHSLATFKAENNVQITSIPVTEIKSVILVSSKGGMNGFKVTSDRKEFVFYSGEAKKWIQSIEQIASSQSFPKIMISDTEVKEKVRKVFIMLKQQLLDREKSLLALNDSLCSLSLVKAQKEISDLEGYQMQIQEKYSLFKETSKKSCFPELETLSQLPKEQEKNALKVHIETKMLPKMLVDSMNVDCVNPFELSIVRSNIVRALKWRYSDNKIDALSFSVSEDVFLTSIGICRPYRAGGQITVQKLNILKGPTIESRSVYIYKKKHLVTHSAEETICKIPLLASIMIKKNTVHTVCFVIEGSPSYKCVDCQSVCTFGDFTWQFYNTEFSCKYRSNQTDSVCGPIASFFFMPANG